MFRDDLERSGFAEGSSIGAKVTQVWQIPAFNTTEYGAVKGSPSVVGDTLYCGTDTGRFVAVRISDGALIWQIQLNKTSHGIHGSPAIVGDVVYIGAYDGTLYAFERSSGLLLWRHQLGYQVGSSPAVVPQWGVVYSAHERSPLGGGYLIALDARTGQELWRRPLAAHPHSSAAVDIAKRIVFVGDNLGVIYAFDAFSGRELWQRELDRGDGKADIKTTPTVIPDRNLLVFGAWSGRVYALDEATGQVAWEYVSGSRIMGSTAYLPTSGTIYVGTPLGKLHAIDARTGTARWIFNVGARVLSSPAVSGDGKAVVFGAGDGRVYALRTDTGAVLWDTYIGGQVSGSPALVGDRIYVTSKKGGLWALATYD
jgi:outer membrane protein assembly factor BamB